MHIIMYTVQVYKCSVDIGKTHKGNLHEDVSEPLACLNPNNDIKYYKTYRKI